MTITWQTELRAMAHELRTRAILSVRPGGELSEVQRLACNVADRCEAIIEQHDRREAQALRVAADPVAEDRREWDAEPRW